jgi:hypothetical protein
MEKCQLKTRLWFKRIGQIAARSVKRLSHEQWFDICAEVCPSPTGAMLLLFA